MTTRVLLHVVRAKQIRKFTTISSDNLALPIFLERDTNFLYWQTELRFPPSNSNLFEQALGAMHEIAPLKTRSTGSGYSLIHIYVDFVWCSLG